MFMGIILLIIIVVVIFFIIKGMRESAEFAQARKAGTDTQAIVNEVVDRDGSPGDIKIGIFDGNSAIAGNQYELVKMLLFVLVKEGYEIDRVGIDTGGFSKKPYGEISFKSYGRIQFTKYADVINNYWPGIGWSSNLRSGEWSIIDGSGVFIQEAYSYSGIKPSDFMQACAHFYHENLWGSGFIEPDGFSSVSSYSKLGQMHEYIKTGAKSW